MGPDPPLPLPTEFDSVDDYVESLLSFATSSWLLQTLCGGVHILDFYTRTPDLYSTILPESWRLWFKQRDMMDILDFLMREDLSRFDEKDSTWRDGPQPPKDLLQYVKNVRKHLLAREFPPPSSRLQSQNASIARHVAVGMKVKKVHEVDNFARYVDKLTTKIAASTDKEITHLIDFGSGQNYLGRALAAPPYSKHLVAVESKQHNIEGAKTMDMRAKLVAKPLVMRNKKEYRAKMGIKKKSQEKGVSEDESVLRAVNEGFEKPQSDVGNHEANASESKLEDPLARTHQAQNRSNCNDDRCVIKPVSNTAPEGSAPTAPTHKLTAESRRTVTTTLQIYTEGHGSVQYVEHIIKNGDLGPVIDQVLDSSRVQEDNREPRSAVVEEPSNLEAVPKPPNVSAMVISLHSCGNLVHHGLRSLLLNPSVSAVAMVGCCYNLVTERLGPATYKLPTLKRNHPRLEKTSNAFDPHGFPMSKKLVNYPLPHATLQPSGAEAQSLKGIRLNITARMMAVQAPFNWGPVDSELFFTRHFYRALLQRIFLERGVISAPVEAKNVAEDGIGVSAAGHTSRVNWIPPNGRGPGLSSDGSSTPLTIGTLRKFAYNDFLSYVRAATKKLTEPNSFCEVDPDFIQSKMDGLRDEDIRDFEERYSERKKELSVMWSLMAFSAGVVEAIVVTDRWLWLKEQDEVKHAWVEPVFEYKQSPRNLVIVGLKK